MGRRLDVSCRWLITLTLILAVMFVLPLFSLAQSKPFDKDGVEKDNPFERLKAQEASTGKVTPVYRDKVLREAQKHNERVGRTSSGVNLGTPGQTTSGPTWINIGPFGQDFGNNGTWNSEEVDSGRLRTILVHPTDPNIVYILASAGGLWKTTNFQDAKPNWTPLTDYLPTTAGGAAAFGRNGDTIYLGLGDPYDQITVGGAVVKSTDGGNTWSPLFPLGYTISVRDLKVDTTGDTDVVLVATDGGLWRSTDAGATYSQVTNHAFQDQYIWSLARTSAGWVMATQETQNQTNGTCGIGTRWCTGAGHIYLSTDKGASWTEQTFGLPTLGFGRTTLAVAVEGDKDIYAFSAVTANGTSAATNQKDLYRSQDGGKTWVALGVNSTKIPVNPNPYQTNMNIMNGQAWYNQTILVDPTDPTRNTVYLGGTYSSAKTTDGGATWKILSEWLPGYTAATTGTALPYVHADMHTMAYKATGTPMVLLGCDGGLFATPDGGATWISSKNNNLVTHMFYSIIGNPQFPNFAMGGLQDNGTRVRSGSTGTFNQTTGGDGFGVGMSQANAETSFQSVYYNKLYAWRTKQVPESQPESFLSLPGQSQSSSPFNTPVISPSAQADPTGKIFFSQGLTRLYKTSDGGMSWSAFSSIGVAGSGLETVSSFRDSPFALGVSPTNINHLAVGANNGRVFVSLDGGAHWTYNLISNAPAGWPGFVSGVTWADDNTIWVASNSQSEGLYTGIPTVRVVKSSDQGANWVAAGTGLPDVPVTKVIGDPRNVQVAYAATHVGVYRTIDGGASWEPYGSGLPNVRVNDLYMPPDGGYIRIATYGRGIWQLSNIDFGGVTLTNDGGACTKSGAIGNNETGHLNLTFSNPSLFPVEGGTVTVTSDNSHLTFTAGNSAPLGTIAANGQVTVALAAKVQGASGIETANLTISYGESAVVTITRPISLNYDDSANVATNVSWESTKHGFTVSSTNTPAPGQNFVWVRREITPVQHTFAVVDANGPQDSSLVSPVLKVGTGNFSFSFNQRWWFENSVSGGVTYYWDGGIIEISTDNGTTWTPVATPAYNGTIYGGPAGFVGRSTGWPSTVNSTVDLGTTYAGKDVVIRFRMLADDNGGAPGWEISDLSFTGLTNTPFGALAAHNEVCTGTTVVVASAPNPSNYPDLATFTATVSGGVTPATGVVTLKEGATVIGSANAVNGVATITSSTLAVGSHYVVASFAGDAGHVAADSPQYKHTVLAVPRTSLTPGSLDFGDLHTGSTSAVQTVILKNTGLNTLVINGFTVTGEFAQTNNCSTMLAANVSCTVSVTFKPVSNSGTRTGAITIASNAVSGTSTIALTGNAQTPETTLDHTALTFASTLVGDTATAQVVTVSNTGNLPLNISAIAISGDYAQNSDCTTAPIAAGASCTISVTFTPTATGTRTGTITLTDDGAGAPHTISLTGTGAQAARIALAPTSLNFGNVRIGKISVAGTSTLQNTGTTPLQITSITASEQFAVTHNCEDTIAPGASCTLSITFRPVGARGTRTGTVTLVTNAISGPTSIALTGVAAKPEATITGGTLSYANTLVAASTAAQTATITNTGDLPLTISGFTTNGDYTQTSDCTAAPIAPGAHCTVSITFTPTATGTRAGSIAITSDADETPTIAASGKGELLQISGTTTQAVSVKNTATYPLTLKASSAVTGTVSVACSGNPALTTCAVSTPSFTSGTAQVNVTVTPAPTTTTAANRIAGQVFFAMFGLFGLFLLPVTRKASGRKVLSMILLALVITASVGGMVACGGGSTPAPTTPTTTTTFATPGTYTLTVTATSGTTTLQTQTLTLTLQ